MIIFLDIDKPSIAKILGTDNFSFGPVSREISDKYEAVIKTPDGTVIHYALTELGYQRVLNKFRDNGMPSKVYLSSTTLPTFDK